MTANMTATARCDERVVGAILAFIILGFPVMWAFVSDPGRFAGDLDFAQGRTGTLLGWVLAAAVALEYMRGTARIPAVRATMLRWDLLKAVAIVAAVVAGVLEEVIFRRWVMDYLEDRHVSGVVQVLASGASFGIGHAVWGSIRGSVHVAWRAVAATTVLGLALGVVYLLSDRSLAACIVSHFVITALIEPGLLLAAVRGDLGLRTARG